MSKAILKKLIQEEVRKALNEDTKTELIKLGYEPDTRPVNVNISTEDFLAILEPILPALTASVKKNAGKDSSAPLYGDAEAYRYFKDYNIAMSKYTADVFNKLIKGSLKTDQKVSGAPQLPPYKKFDSHSYVAYIKANDAVRYSTTYGVFLAEYLGDYIGWMESYGDSLSMYNNRTISKVITALDDINSGRNPDVDMFKLAAEKPKRGPLPDFYKNIGKELKASLGTPSGKWIIDEDGEELWKKKNPSAEDLIKVYLKFLKNSDINTQEEYVDANSSNIKSFSNWNQAIKDIAGETGDGYGYNITDDIVLVNIM
jgi:hypothetical protein